MLTIFFCGMWSTHDRHLVVWVNLFESFAVVRTEIFCQTVEHPFTKKYPYPCGRGSTLYLNSLFQHSFEYVHVHAQQWHS